MTTADGSSPPGVVRSGSRIVLPGEIPLKEGAGGHRKHLWRIGSADPLEDLAGGRLHRDPRHRRADDPIDHESNFDPGQAHPVAEIDPDPLPDRAVPAAGLPRGTEVVVERGIGQVTGRVLGGNAADFGR